MALLTPQANSDGRIVKVWINRKSGVNPESAKAALKVCGVGPKSVGRILKARANPKSDG